MHPVVLLAAALLTPTLRNAIDRAMADKGVYAEQEDAHRINSRCLPKSSAAFEGTTYTDLSDVPKPATGVLVSAELLLLESEVTPVMSAALDAGLEITALHNRNAAGDVRRVVLRLGGMGDTATMATAVKRTLDKACALRAKAPASHSGSTTSLDASALDRILGRKGVITASAYHIAIPRKAKLQGQPISSAMGLEIWAEFTGSTQAARIEGEFALHAVEMQPVLRALLMAGFQIDGIHNHMTEDEPHYFFVHFYGQGKAETLATGLKGALDELGRYTSLSDQ